MGDFSIRLFGTEPDDTPYRYPGTVNSKYGVALVFPGYHIFTKHTTAAMTLDKHQIDVLVVSARSFYQQISLKNHCLALVTQSQVQHQQKGEGLKFGGHMRLFDNVGSIYSEDKSIVITAYQV